MTASATPLYSPRPRETAHHSLSQPRPQRTALTPRAVGRTPGSVGEALPPTKISSPHTPHHVVHETRQPSPNYFGLTFDAPTDAMNSSNGKVTRSNWDPPSSNVRSTAAASPSLVPVDQNPDYEAFRRQSETNKGFAFGGSLSEFNIQKPNPRRTGSKTGIDETETATSPRAIPLGNKAHTTANSTSPKFDLTPKPRSPKRVLSPDPQLFPDRVRRNSPASFEDSEARQAAEAIRFLPDHAARPSLPSNSMHASQLQKHSRSETLPASFDDKGRDQGPIVVTPQHVVNLLESAVDEILLLDLRISTQYARSRITGALNLCIPTTLLKRPTFNVQKLADTFRDEDSRDKFESWRSSKYIIVYDGNSSQLKDATLCVNTLKKFAVEDWHGASYIIRGGFFEFSKKFPNWIHQEQADSPTAATANLSLEGSMPAVAPVAGGCPMPATKNAANPFFGNIRQNMDLIGGVGQMPVKRPASMSKQMEEELPAWLRKAVDERDNGKRISDKFLEIERREQRRMQEALSGHVSYGSPRPDANKSVQIAGIEKGTKNRYNSIWPYEHSRVKLQGVAEGGCDYVNANHIKASWSNKQYIATQGPLPTTFSDFWNVVWQQDVRVIVMLTAEKEGGQLKAHNYWDTKRYGHLKVDFLHEHRASLEPARIHRRKDRPSMGKRRSSTNPQTFKEEKDAIKGDVSPTSDQPYVIVRNFTLSNQNEPWARMREVTQLQYSSWPDFGAPADPAHLLGLIEQCDAVVRATSGTQQTSGPEPTNTRPILVHCSAGCGRTGTFCTVDSVIDMMKRQRHQRSMRQGTPMDIDPQGSNPAPKQDSSSPFFGRSSSDVDGGWIWKEDEDLIEKTVEDFRLQRLSMVQSLRQFVLCYESVTEWLVDQAPKTA